MVPCELDSSAAGSVTFKEQLACQHYQARCRLLEDRLRSEVPHSLGQLEESDAHWIGVVQHIVQATRTAQQQLQHVASVRRAILEERLRSISLRLRRYYLMCPTRQEANVCVDLRRHAEQLLTQLADMERSNADAFLEDNICSEAAMRTCMEEITKARALVRVSIQALSEYLIEHLLGTHESKNQLDEVHRTIEFTQAQLEAYQKDVRDTTVQAILEECTRERQSVIKVLRADVTGNTIRIREMKKRLEEQTRQQEEKESRMRAQVERAQVGWKREKDHQRLYDAGLEAEMHLLHHRLLRLRRFQ